MNYPNVPNQYPVTGTKKTSIGQIIIFAVIAILIVVLSVILIFVLKSKQNNQKPDVMTDIQSTSTQTIDSLVTVNGTNTQFGYYIEDGMRSVSLTGFCNHVGFKYRTDGDVYIITPSMGGQTTISIKDKKFVRINAAGEKVEGNLTKLVLFYNDEMYVLAKELAGLFENVQTEYIAETGKTNIIVS